jgi:hypothetical protein
VHSLLGQVIPRIQLKGTARLTCSKYLLPHPAPAKESDGKRRQGFLYYCHAIVQSSQMTDWMSRSDPYQRSTEVFLQTGTFSLSLSLYGWEESIWVREENGAKGWEEVYFSWTSSKIRYSNSWHCSTQWGARKATDSPYVRAEFWPACTILQPCNIFLPLISFYVEDEQTVTL